MTQHHLSLKTRLILVGLIALLLSVVPSALLIGKFASESEQAAREAQGLPPNEAWQAALKTLQIHRQLGAETLSTRPAAREELPAAQQAVRAALAAVTARLAANEDASARNLAAVKAVASEFDLLAADLRDGKLDSAKLLAGQQALAAQTFRAMGELNHDAGLSLEVDPALYHAVIAGLQISPQVGDALSELSSMARAAAVDEIAQLTAALTRYRENNEALQQEMRLAIHASGSESHLAPSLSALLPQAQQQRKLVDDALKAASLDVNYPLEQLAASFSNAAALQSDLSAQVLKTLGSELTQRRESSAFKRNALLITLVVLLAVMGMVMLRAMRRLLAPVAQMIEVAERIAGGDLSQPVPQGRRDEMGRVLVALQHMQARLRQLVEEIHAGAGNIRSAAQEIALGNQDLASRTEQAAAQLQQTSANVDFLDQVVRDSTRAVGEAAGLAQRTSGVAGDGGRVVEQLASTMASIHESSNRIADITGLIDGLAFQTNILALNAAVEAARAGEQGRGFAVVAAEVRSLAGRSAAAAREIKVLIQHSVERVESGATLATDAGASMQRILAQVNQVSSVIQGMDGRARSQAEQTHDLGDAVRAIDAMTQQNAALVEQSAASALSLRGQAESMDAAVQAFRL
ncbi:methyl-accepting chemotaxis protein [Roseateles sp. PN1]|uniref:methyl-accepting chemotaxis protein n=1 Tax=Roseateles sp. PN1 TaxID=3137372 RepID=UPI00313A39C9